MDTLNMKNSGNNDNCELQKEENANDRINTITSNEQTNLKEGEKLINDKMQKNKQRKKREASVLADTQIIKARLRSDSGKVYSSGLVVDSASGQSAQGSQSGQSSPALSVVDEEENPNNDNDNDIEMCLSGECCRNTSKIIEMISKLQKSVDGVLTKTTQQEIVSSNNIHRIEDVQEACDKNANEIEELANELSETKFQLKLVTKIVIKQDQQIGFLNQKILDIQQREMFPNVVITGIPEKARENAIQAFNDFVANELELQELIPANRAFRIGSGRNRPLIVELRHPENKRRLFSSATKLKGKTNPAGNPYFIADHLPEERNEERRQINDLIAENKRKIPSHRLDMNVSKGKLIINEQPYEKAVRGISTRDVLDPDAALFTKAEDIEIVKGATDMQKGSHFASFIAAVEDFEDIRAAHLKLKMKFADATHVACAYRLPGANTPANQDFIDNGEFGCGRTMLKVLREEKLLNVAVFMVRYYGGKHLGLQRYDIFRKLTNQAIRELIESRKKSDPEKEALEVIPDRLRQPQNTDGLDEEWNNTSDWSTDNKED